MKRGLFRRSVPLAVLALLLWFPAAGGAQLVLGQYEDEAPLRSWNVFGTDSGSSLGLGGVRYTVVSDGSPGLTNPALLASIPSTSLSLTGQFASATLFRYSLVNTGVVTTRGNVRSSFYGIGTGSFSLRIGGWTVAVTSCILENYGRPAIEYSFVSEGNTYYSLEMSQSGFLRGYNVAVGRGLGGRLSFGLGLNYASGRRSRLIVERRPVSEITITDDREEKISGIFLNGGLLWEVSPALSAALVFRTPHTRKADAGSLSRYEAPQGGTDIRIEAEARNEYLQPWVVGGGLGWRIGGKLAAAADLTYFGWSRYSILYFDESPGRRFRDVLQIAAGLEYLISFRIEGRSITAPLRLGVSVDPQPMKEPRSSYTYIGFGSGLRLGSWTMDVGSRFGWESGSGDGLSAVEVALTLGYSIGRF